MTLKSATERKIKRKGPGWKGNLPVKILNLGTGARRGVVEV
jgi:hypothetical protein